MTTPHEAALRLRERSSILRAVRLERVVGTLEALRELWLFDESPWMRRACGVSSGECGLSSEMMDHVLRHLFSQISASSIRQIAWTELGAGDSTFRFASDPNRSVRYAVVPPALGVHILSSSTPTLALETMVLSLILRTPCLIRPPSACASFAHDLHASLKEVDEELAEHVRVVSWPSDDNGTLQSVLSSAELVVCWGSDDTLHTIREATPISARFCGYGHRLSFGLIGEGDSKVQLHRLSDEIARDVVVQDQHGCMSPHTYFVHENAPVSVEDLAHRLAKHSLPALGAVLPRGRLSDHQSAQIMQLRGETEFSGRAYTGRDYTIVLRDEPCLASGPGGRTLHLSRYTDFSEIEEVVRPYRDHLSTCGLWTPPKLRDDFALRLANAGVQRITRPGRMQYPLWLRHHDGRPRLSDWCSFANLEYTPTPGC